ncbi:hypothetical protein HN51_055039 [Arachis hypogaea]|nr:uncharacterized protein LOC112776474 isoform X1 [Arachis hypogaea]XP_025676427.1 uncharacterized protein LOC112776474 isoform X1 [Arachis hypogaea]XP_025676428.1 uncharacterized protein LOC112776474 isoform X1 [Arachis hypogaea]XP_025676429.1 uncharacterized protein LOC112776474 isoform X1 [Arachis hypogaea]XP_025676430.1 uncharacterized protein LOC112776474 isoform X1 [Arachis hypogaea]XP_025676433.1 uncharacterized protein LOC112776474 isoform X1 [Arachis hypogaea]XP_025676434.1 uncharac
MLMLKSQTKMMKSMFSIRVLMTKNMKTLTTMKRRTMMIRRKVAGPSGQMTWIRGGPKCLDGSNIIEAIDNRYVPMFGETEYGPIHQYPSIGIGEQLKLSEELSKLGRLDMLVLLMKLHMA